MRRYLVVANLTLGGSKLLDQLKQLAGEQDCAFHILVPATPPTDFAFRTSGEGEALAAYRLEQAKQAFANLGADITGEVGDARPLDAIGDVLRRGEDWDGIVLSTLPAGVSRWLRRDLPHQVQRHYPDLPLIHVEAEPEIAASEIVDHD